MGRVAGKQRSGGGIAREGREGGEVGAEEWGDWRKERQKGVLRPQAPPTLKGGGSLLLEATNARESKIKQNLLNT